MIDSSQLLRSILEQRYTLCTELKSPRQIYMDHRTATLLTQEMSHYIRTGSLEGGFYIAGLRVRVHDDFPEPVVS